MSQAVARKKGRGQTLESCHSELIMCHRCSRHFQPAPHIQTFTAPSDQTLGAQVPGLPAAASGFPPGSLRSNLCVASEDTGVMTLRKNSGPASQGTAYREARRPVKGLPYQSTGQVVCGLRAELLQRQSLRDVPTSTYL